jgi:PKHD-type hydroxylase
MSHLPIWYLSTLTPEECDRVVAELCVLEGRDATMGVGGEEHNHQTRNTTVRFADQTYWLADTFERLALDANRICGWEYHITGRECVQFAEYGPEQHYAWHTDTFALSGQPIDRKVTVVCLLNDDFTGGDFEVRLYSDYKAPLEKGSVIAFPSILEHRVTPVLTGTRRSATLWLNGPRFR